MLTNLAAGHLQYQIPVGINPHTLCALEAELNRTWVGVGPYNKIIFEMLLVAVEDEVHTWINFLVAHPLIIRDPGSPGSRVSADEVIAPAGQFLLALNDGRRVSANKGHSEHG